MFVELPNTVEGLIRLAGLTDDYYHFDEASSMSLIGERTSKVFRIGDEVKIRVARVNMDDHTIDFEMVDMPRRERRPGGGFGGRGERGGRVIRPAAAAKPAGRASASGGVRSRGRLGRGREAQAWRRRRRRKRPGGGRERRGQPAEDVQLRLRQGRLQLAAW
ncbi:S1 RNA-binding domain-containing protein [Paenibacillus sp. JTLBN-2024]